MEFTWWRQESGFLQEPKKVNRYVEIQGFFSPVIFLSFSSLTGARIYDGQLDGVRRCK